MHPLAILMSDSEGITTASIALAKSSSKYGIRAVWHLSWKTLGSTGQGHP